jgi:hypothetical protein
MTSGARPSRTALAGLIVLTLLPPKPMALAVAAAMAALGLALGCGSAESPATTISLTNADHGRSIAVLVGDEIEITLQTIGPGEYGTPVVSSGSGSIRFLGEGSPGPQNPGGVRQLFRFEAVAPGGAEISIPHMGGFPVPPRDPFFVAVEVR